MTQPVPSSDSSWVLAIDFGTTNTVAAIADSTGTHMLEIEGNHTMPSAVLLFGDGTEGGRRWKVGHEAIRGAYRSLEWFDANPKRSVADQTLFLGGTSVPVVEAIAAVYRFLAEQAQRQRYDHPPSAFVVTHPAAWAEARVQLLLDAAQAATAQLSGWPAPIPLPEPTAAAQQTLQLDAVPEDSRIVVLDLGGGTVDAMVVDRHAGTLTPGGQALGLDALGGEDFDLRLARWMAGEVAVPGLYDRLAGSRDLDERERAIRIRRQAQAVKEELSRRAVVPAQLPSCPPELPEGAKVQVNRAQFEQLVVGGRGRSPGLTEAVQLIDQALTQADPGPPLAGVFLVGGSSRIPLLGALVTEATGKPPITHADPTTAVAEGAAAFGWEVSHTTSGGEHRRTPTSGSSSPAPADSSSGQPSADPPPATPTPRGQPRRGAILVLGGLALVLVIAIVAALLRPGPHPPPDPTYTCGNGQVVTSSSNCSPSPDPTPTFTCWNQQVVRSSSDCSPSPDPTPTFTCWDGQVVTSSSDCSPSPTPTPSSTCWNGKVVDSVDQCPTRYVGTVVGGSPIAVLASPSVNSPTVGSLPNGAIVSFACRVVGDSVSGPASAGNNWFYVGSGYVPMAYVAVPTNQDAPPVCA